jgi:Ni/Co efflux regulator RcnB
MTHLSSPRSRALLLCLSCVLACAPALAGKPEWAGNGGGKHKSKDEQHTQPHTSVEVRIGGYFGEDQRASAQNYYGTQYAGKKCPPGLAKKNNGCQPPGQAKKWAMGQPLPRDVVMYPVPRAVSVRLGVPPSGYRYVRVANDILLIAIGTSMVVDAIQDLMRP